MKMNVNWKTMLVAGLTVCLAVSLFFNGYLYYELTRPTEHQSPTFFSFVWSPEQQNITEGPLYINMTFERIDENLSVIIKINDDDYHAGGGEQCPDFLLIVFDFDGDGEADLGMGYWFTSDNRTMTSGSFGWELEKGVTIAAMLSTRLSVLHTCTFKAGEGYVFNCTFPIAGGYFHGNEAYPIKSDVVAVGFEDTDGYVYVPPFHFGVDVT